MDCRAQLVHRTNLDLRPSTISRVGNLQERPHRIPGQATSAHQEPPPQQHVEPLRQARDPVARVQNVFAHHEPAAGLEEAVEVGDALHLVGDATQDAQAHDFVKQLQVRRRRLVAALEQACPDELGDHGVQIRRGVQNVVLPVQPGLRGLLA